MKLQQFFEFINGKSGVPDYTTHCVGIDRIITGDSEESCAVRHDDMFSPISKYTEPCFFQCSDGSKMINSGDLWHN